MRILHLSCLISRGFQSGSIGPGGPGVPDGQGGQVVRRSGGPGGQVVRAVKVFMMARMVQVVYAVPVVALQGSLFFVITI